ncbi:MAG TPA: nitronate monooxygenase family protein [Steroidobacteraceae bacterium]|nr:nitronate monooxygenase family protein [Steroidobacteraceae bacterium]
MPIPASLAGRLTLPLIGAPMFIASTPELVVAQCKAGIIGAFPALNARPASMLEEWLLRIRGELDEYSSSNPSVKVAPFAVNQIAHASNDRLVHDVEVCVRHEVPLIITSLRPPREIVEAVHSYGGLLFHDVISLRHARKAAEQGVDGIIAVCAGAGGHAGGASPFALLKEIRSFFDGTLILSGAMTSGGDVFAALALGADMAYVGTRFLATTEANVPPEYKQMIVESSSDEVVWTSLFTGVRGNYLKRSVAAAGLDPENLPEADKSAMDFGSGGNMGKKAWRDIWSAGQGVGNIHETLPTRELVARMRREFDAARERLCAAT